MSASALERDVKASGRRGGRILVDALRLNGTDRIFCVPGESDLEVLDALYDMPEIDLVVCRHEGAAANMAEADGKLTGRPGICFVTRGPRCAHAAVGIHTAFYDPTPMILFVGQVETGVRGREASRKVDIARMFEPVAKWTAEIDTIDRSPELVRRPFRIATSGRRGPVMIRCLGTCSPTGPTRRIFVSCVGQRHSRGRPISGRPWTSWRRPSGHCSWSGDRGGPTRRLSLWACSPSETGCRSSVHSDYRTVSTIGSPIMSATSAGRQEIILLPACRIRPADAGSPRRGLSRHCRTTKSKERH